MPAEPVAALHERCDAWAVVEARQLDRIAQAGGGLSVDYLDGRPSEYFRPKLAPEI
jgi:hypothetical protein